MRRRRCRREQAVLVALATSLAHRIARHPSLGAAEKHALLMRLLCPPPWREPLPPVRE